METPEACDYSDLVKRGIKTTIRHGEDWFGNRQKTIICVDGTQWDYLPEDQYYEQRLEDLFVIN